MNYITKPNYKFKLTLEFLSIKIDKLGYENILSELLICNMDS